VAIELARGQLLKVICPRGEQVADMVAYNRQDHKEYLSNGKTFDYEMTLRLTTGNFLYSNKSQKMLEIIADTCGTHDFLLAPCCPATMQYFYNMEVGVHNCRDNLYQALQQYKIDKSDIPTAFNIFMNVPIYKDYRIKVAPSTAIAGDYIIVKASMDLLVGITACAAGDSNNHSFKSIHYSILPG
jgi:uncharacterized protein YcgI (DUF1989 family)